LLILYHAVDSPPAVDIRSSPTERPSFHIVE
jgi:hypothetical protein